MTLAQWAERFIGKQITHNMSKRTSVVVSWSRGTRGNGVWFKTVAGFDVYRKPPPRVIKED